MKIWCTTRLVLPHRCTEAKQASAFFASPHLIWHPSCFGALSSIWKPPAAALSPPLIFSSSLQIYPHIHTLMWAFITLVQCIYCPQSSQKEAMKNAPLDDPLGVRNGRSVRTWFWLLRNYVGNSSAPGWSNLPVRVHVSQEHYYLSMTIFYLRQWRQLTSNEYESS